MGNLFPPLPAQSIGSYELTPIGDGSYRLDGSGTGRLDKIPVVVPQRGKVSVEGSTLGDNVLALFAGSRLMLHSSYGPRTAWLEAGAYQGTLVISHSGVITPVIRLIG